MGLDGKRLEEYLTFCVHFAGQDDARPFLLNLPRCSVRICVSLGLATVFWLTVLLILDLNLKQANITPLSPDTTPQLSNCPWVYIWAHQNWQKGRLSVEQLKASWLYDQKKTRGIQAISIYFHSAMLGNIPSLLIYVLADAGFSI